MKPSVLIILSTLLVVAINAPSIIFLTDAKDKAIVIDFNEEEKKEEKKESKENDFFQDYSKNTLNEPQIEKVCLSNFYFHSNYATYLRVFVPPPKYKI